MGIGLASVAAAKGIQGGIYSPRDYEYREKKASEGMWSKTGLDRWL